MTFKREIQKSRFYDLDGGRKILLLEGEKVNQKLSMEIATYVQQ